MPQQAGHDDELGWYMTGSRVEIADILAEFAQELRNGDINVWKGQRELHLDPHGKLELRVQAVADDDGRQALEMKLSWTSTSAAFDMHSGANMGVELGRPESGMGNE